MGLGIVSDDDFLKELDNSASIERDRDKVIIPEIMPLPTPGRKEGDNNVPESLRTIIADEVLTNGRQAGLDIARRFDISDSSVSAYTNGANSTTTYDKKVNGKKINNIKLNLTKKATRLAFKALNNITDDKLSDAKATDLAMIAKSMSGMVKDMEPDDIDGRGQVNQPQIIVYVPQIREEHYYETIRVNE